MKKSKTSKKSKTKVQVRDLKPVKNAKGGACASGEHYKKALL